MMNGLDSAAARNEGILLLAGRIGICILFIWAGVGKLMDLPGAVGYVASLGGPNSTVLVVIAAIVEMVGGVAILVGFQTRLAAVMLFVYTIVVTLIGHHFWTETDPMTHLNQVTQFCKNLVILGGFLFVFVHGPGSLSIDRR